MFINKISNSLTNKPSFKGFQYEKNDFGSDVLRFNFPFDHSRGGQIQFFKVKKDENAGFGYVVEDHNPISTAQITPEGTVVNMDKALPGLDRNEPFAYRISIYGDQPIADTGIQIGGYTLVPRLGTKPVVQGAGALTLPDSHRPGAYYKEDGTVGYNKEKQIIAENAIRTFSNKYGGNLAGLEYDLDTLKDFGVKYLFTTPVAGADNKSSHHYWNKNNMQISDDMGNIDNFGTFMNGMFQRGMVYVYDGTFTSEGLEGIHFQYALRWADKDPASYYWFRMSGLKDASLALGVVPQNKENLRHRVINPPYEYNPETGKIEKNHNYDSNKETLIQIYDGSQVSDEQLAVLDKPIETYEKLKTGNPLAINSHDDTIINYVCEIDPNEYTDRLKAFVDYNKNIDTPLEKNSPDGTIFIAQFSNFRFYKKTDGGFVTWDANTDMVKMNYHISGYDETLNQASTNPSEKEYLKQRQIRGSYEVRDMALQAAKYWTGRTKALQTIYTAQTLKGASSLEAIQELINKQKLPSEVALTEKSLENLKNNRYKLEPKGILDKDDATTKALMKLPLDALEVADNTAGVLSSPYFSNRATNDKTLGKTRFELAQESNPHLVEPYAENYLKTNRLFTNEIKNFTDEVIKKINEGSTEKLLTENEEYTEYGEYVIDLFGQEIAKYALLKAIAGDKAVATIQPNGVLTYNYKEIREATTLKSLGIQAHNPTDEASALRRLIEKGLKKLDNDSVDTVAKSISQRISGTNTLTFNIAEAMVDKAGLGLSWRLDAAKDVIDMDAVRNRYNTFDEAWQYVIDFWKDFVKAVKSENPNAYIVAEITDVEDLMKAALGEDANPYDIPGDLGLKFKNVNDAMEKFYVETGIVSEAAYSYTFTDLLKTFAAELEKGSMNTDSSRPKDFMERIRSILRNRTVDYVRNLYTFADNHDKPSVIHGMAIDMGIFHANFEDNNNEYQRKIAMELLTNTYYGKEMPLEARLNINNIEYFRTVSPRAIAAGKLFRDVIDEDLGDLATLEQKQQLKTALVDLINGNFKGEGSNFKVKSIDIPALDSLDNALTDILTKANICLSAEDFRAVIDKANEHDFFNRYHIRGDMSWRENKNLAKSVLQTDSDSNDFLGYSLFSLSIAALLKDAFMTVVQPQDNWAQAFSQATADFAKQYNAETVNAKRTPLPIEEPQEKSMAKNGFAARDFKTSIQMLIDQAEYNTGKTFENAEAIFVKMYRAMTEPAVQKAVMYASFLSGLPGIPTLFLRDMLGGLGLDDKAKNNYLQNRNTITWEELEQGPLKEYRNQIKNMFVEAMQIRSREGTEALNNGTPYEAYTSDESIPAIMMQDSKGNINISLFNAKDINPYHRFNYHNKYGINSTESKNGFYGDNNNIETINNDNPYVPAQPGQEIDHITLGAGLGLALGTVFVNTDTRDKARYIYKTIERGGHRFNAIVNESGKIFMNGVTAKNGVMVLRAFRGRKPNSPALNFTTNPYVKKEIPVQGEKLSVIAR